MSIEKTDGEPPFRNPDLPLHQWQPAVPRLGLAAFRTGTEVRGFHHKDPVAHGLNVWAPVVNPLRDRRWGRNEEGYSEDGVPGATCACR